MPHPAAARADDFPGHALRIASDGVEAGHRERGVCASGHRHHRRPERLAGGDDVPRSLRIPVALPRCGPSASRASSGAGSVRAGRFSIVLAALGLPLFAQAPRTLTLQDAEMLAIQQHPQVAGARLETQAAGQVVRATRSPLFPQLFANASAVGAVDSSRIAAGFLNAPNVLNRAAAGLAVQQLVTDFGRTGHLVDASRLTEQSQQVGEAATRASVLLDVDRAYFRALR